MSSIIYKLITNDNISVLLPLPSQIQRLNQCIIIETETQELCFNSEMVLLWRRPSQFIDQQLYPCDESETLDKDLKTYIDERYPDNATIFPRLSSRMF
jgi:muconolactone delta-isomerase